MSVNVEPVQAYETEGHFVAPADMKKLTFLDILAYPRIHWKERSMSIELEVQKFPKRIVLKDDFQAELRPLKKDDEKEFHQFFLDVPGQEHMFIKHRVTEPQVIRDWCQNIDLGHNFPLLAIVDQKIVGCATLHQQFGGWKRHIGRVSVLVLPQHRGRGLARAMVTEITHISRNVGLHRIEAEFIGGQAAAIKMFAMLGFSNLARFEDYVKDMQGVTHDYVLMGLILKVDEEYAGVGG
jgi:L-amino acid N-acyltransferase YncA